MVFEANIGASINRDDLLEKLSENLSEKRFLHVQNVAATAKKLAEHWGYLAVEKAELAGLLHDYAKEETDETFKDLIHKYKLDPALLEWNNNIWHGVVGIYKIQEDFGITDPELLRAIEIHTIGSSEMGLLDKILYVADYIEDSRSFEGVETARALAYEDLDAAVAYETLHTVLFLAQKQVQIYPQTIITYNAYVDKLRTKNKS